MPRLPFLELGKPAAVQARCRHGGDDVQEHGTGGGGRRGRDAAVGAGQGERHLGAVSWLVCGGGCAIRTGEGLPQHTSKHAHRRSCQAWTVRELRLRLTTLGVLREVAGGKVAGGEFG